MTTETLALGLALVPVIAGIGSLAGGLVVHHRGSRIVLRLTAPLVPIAVLVASSSTSMALLLVSLAGVGLVLGAADAAMAIQALVVQRSTSRPVIGRGYAFFAIGGIAASLIASATTAAGWRPAQTALLIAVVGVPASTVAGFFLPHERYVVEEQAESTDSTRSARRLVAPALAVVSAQIVDAAVSTWAALFLHVGLGIDEAGAALGYGAYAFASTGARLITDRLLADRSPNRVVLAAAALGGAGALALALSDGLVPALLALGLLGLGVGPIVPSAFVAVGRDPRSVPRDIARLNACNYLGYLVGTPLVSIVASTAGVTRSIPLTAGALIGAIPLARSREAVGATQAPR